MNINQSSVSQPSFENLDKKMKTKAANLEDPYKYSPKQEGDPWEVLLKPEIEADQVRCDSWKEEVQNLLIFAGLFSSVVTSFVINSYQTLQQGPNDVIIGLLFHIASGLDTSSPFPPSVDPTQILSPFSPTVSSVRINALWFISLILSLTTVLIGTIALQWLREHQYYPGCSAKEKLTILHMRTEALEAWHVPQIFSALPLMLQAALILFLAGLIDFATFLGTKLMIVISVFVGITLFFLATTTVCPAVQGLTFFFRRFQNNIPTPCPFKSPQSDAFRALVELLSRVFFFLFPCCTVRHIDTYFAINPLPNAQRHLAPYIYNLLQVKAGPPFDKQWLSLRDACNQRLYDKDPKLYEHRQEWIEWDGSDPVFPLSDVTQCVLKAVKETSSVKYTDAYLTAAYRCFEELSLSIWKFQRCQDRRNYYFEQLQKHDEGVCSLYMFLVHGGTYKYTEKPLTTDYVHEHAFLFYRDQLYLFIDMLRQKHFSPALARYQLELQLRMMQYLFVNHVASASRSLEEHSLEPTLFDMPVIYSTTSELHPSQKYSVVVDTLYTILNAASHDVSKEQLINALCNSQISTLICKLAALTDEYLRKARESPGIFDLQKIGDHYEETFKFATNHLAAEITSPKFHTASLPCLFFYLSSLFAWQWLRNFPDPNSLQHQRSFTEGVRPLLHTIRDYRKAISDRKDNEIEARLQTGKDPQVWDDDARALVSIKLFSPKWWEQFDHDSDKILNLPNVDMQPTRHSHSIDPTIQRLAVDHESGTDGSASSLGPSFQSEWPLFRPIPTKNIGTSGAATSQGSQTPTSWTPKSNIQILNVQGGQGRQADDQRATPHSDFSSDRSSPSNCEARGRDSWSSAVQFASPNRNFSRVNNRSPLSQQQQSFGPDSPSPKENVSGTANLHPSLNPLSTSRSTAVQQERINDTDSIKSRDNSLLDLGAVIPSIVISPTPTSITTSGPSRDDKEQGDSIIDIQPPRQ